MIQTRDCEEFAGRGCVERYLAHKLASDELDAFEAHFVTCDRCQGAILLGSAIRGALPRVRAAPPARRWVVLAGGLRAALRTGVDSAPAEFFLASSLLMTRQPEEAAAHFAWVIALGDPPHRAEAHFYRAKALLRLDQASDALADLRETAALDRVIGGYARTLTDSIQQVRKR